MPIEWSIEESTAPTVEPVSLTEVKNHLRVDTTADDDDLTLKLAAARRYVEQVTGRALMGTTYKLYLSAWPSCIQLPYPPLSSLTSVKYIDTGGTEQTLSSAYYTTNTVAAPARIVEAYGYSWPSLRNNQWNSITIEYVAGYSTTSDTSTVPDPLKQAILAYVATMYEFREDVAMGGSKVQVPEVVDRLIWPYRTFWEVPWL